MTLDGNGWKPSRGQAANIQDGALDPYVREVATCSTSLVGCFCVYWAAGLRIIERRKRAFGLFRSFIRRAATSVTGFHQFLQGSILEHGGGCAQRHGGCPRCQHVQGAVLPIVVGRPEQLTWETLCRVVVKLHEARKVVDIIAGEKAIAVANLRKSEERFEIAKPCWAN